MFCLIYKFPVIAGKEADFRDEWRTVTEILYEQHGSLGARLHQTADGTFIAYAQWQDRDRWHQGEEAIRSVMHEMHFVDVLEGHVELLFQLDVTDDLLKQELWLKA